MESKASVVSLYVKVECAMCGSLSVGIGIEADVKVI